MQCRNQWLCEIVNKSIGLLVLNMDLVVRKDVNIDINKALHDVNCLIVLLSPRIVLFCSKKRALEVSWFYIQYRTPRVLRINVCILFNYWFRATSCSFIRVFFILKIIIIKKISGFIWSVTRYLQNNLLKTNNRKKF